MRGKCRHGKGRSVALRPPLGSWPGSAALGCAGLAVLVAGLLPATGLLALAPAALTALATGATSHGAAHPGRQR